MDTNQIIIGDGISSFEPLVNDDSEILILGTMPSETSLKFQQYYAHKNNLFWDIIFRIYVPNIKEFDLVPEDYGVKKNILLENKIALWDVLKHCNRKGNLDKEIKNTIKNDFLDFFKKYPKIKFIYFNGKMAENYFNDFHVNTSLIKDNRKFVVLPSTSPTNSQNSFLILKIWKQELKNII